MRLTDRLPADKITTARSATMDVAETARDRITPAVVTAAGATTAALTAAKAKGGEMLESDTAHELRRRGINVLAAAKGEDVGRRRRWPLVMMFFALGGAVGAAASVIGKRLSTRIPELEMGQREYPMSEDGVIDLTPAATEDGVPASDTGVVSDIPADIAGTHPQL